MNAQTVPWQQRFQQFQKSLALLQDAILISPLSVLERAGTIHFFEMSFDFSWKLLKNYEEIEGYIATSPRDTFKKAFEWGILSNGHSWMDALSDRNLTVHTYNEKLALKVEEKIRQTYYPLLLDLNRFFEDKLKKTSS
jgi:nucleotidyltransferase substrate binding protein (TIGR01987 family)